MESLSSTFFIKTQRSSADTKDTATHYQQLNVPLITVNLILFSVWTNKMSFHIKDQMFFVLFFTLMKVQQKQILLQFDLNSGNMRNKYQIVLANVPFELQLKCHGKIQRPARSKHVYSVCVWMQKRRRKLLYI